MKSLIETIETLLHVHRELLALSDEKVEHIKTGNMSALEKLLREEAKLISKLRLTEMVRAKNVQTILSKAGKVIEDATMSDVKELATEAEKEELDRLQAELLSVINELKRKNEQNEELIQESLRFVHLSLDLIAPHKEDIAYSNRPQDDDDRPIIGHSLFDSKA